MREISTTEAASNYGITTKHNEMDNNELRFRLVKTDGTSYIRTESGHVSHWQQSHYHKELYELYIAQEGWIAIALLNNQKTIITILRKYESIIIKPMIIHNVYMTANSSSHSIKFGNGLHDERCIDDNTFFLDNETKGLSETDIMEVAK